MFQSDRFQQTENCNLCSFCGRRLPKHYEGEFCPACADVKLFHDVKDYIRANDVNEYQVAEFFHIPLSKVKGWIREGRIEYRIQENAIGNISSMHCQHCGAPINFGTLCTQCMKLLNKNMHGYGQQKLKQSDDDRMRFLDFKDHK